jgi:hypothetical protein
LFQYVDFTTEYNPKEQLSDLKYLLTKFKSNYGYSCFDLFSQLYLKTKREKLLNEEKIKFVKSKIIEAAIADEELFAGDFYKVIFY